MLYWVTSSSRFVETHVCWVFKQIGLPSSSSIWCLQSNGVSPCRPIALGSSLVMLMVMVLVSSVLLTQSGSVIVTLISAFGRLSGIKSASELVSNSAFTNSPESNILRRSSLLISSRKLCAVSSVIRDLIRFSKDKSNSSLTALRYTGFSYPIAASPSTQK